MNPPITWRSWAWINLKIGALSFGSASRIVLYEEEVVRDRGWMSDNEFNEALTLAQILPGPNLVNLAAAIGLRLFSLPLAVLAILPLLIPGALLAILVFVFVPLDNPWIAEFFRGLALGALLLMVRFLWKLFNGLTAGTPAQLASAAYRRLRPRKSAGRYILSVLIAAIYLAGAPLIPLVLAGAAVSLLWEFAL